MKSPNAIRIYIAILLTVMLLNLVLANHFVNEQDVEQTKKVVKINVHDPFTVNLQKVKNATELNISGENRGCTLTEMTNLIRVLCSLKETYTDILHITFKNLDIAYNKSTFDPRDYINDDDINNDNEVTTTANPTTVRFVNSTGSNANAITEQKKLCQVPRFIRLLQFIDVSPWAMLVLFRRIKFSWIAVFEIQTTCNDISGPLAVLQCNDIASLEIKNSSSTKKYSDLKDNSQYDAKSKWSIDRLSISGKDKMIIPAWILKKTKHIVSLSLRHFFFLPEDSIEELAPEDLYIKNADEMQKEEIKSLFSKRQIRVIGRNTKRRKTSIEFNLQKNQNGEILFDEQYIVFVTKYFAILYSDAKNLVVRFNVETDNDIVIRNIIHNCFMIKNRLEKESLELVLNGEVIAARIHINRTSQEQQEKSEL